MSALTRAQMDALADLQYCWGAVPFTLIGGAALSLQTEKFWRTTSDLDLTVSVGIDEFPGGIESLEGWSPGKHAQRWHGPGNVLVDIIPAGPALLHEQAITWPGGYRMSLVGMRHALEQGVATELRPGLTIALAPLHVIAMLKMVSFTDRPGERDRDLNDIAYLFEYYLGPDDDRRFMGVVEDEVTLGYPEAPAYVLARDIARLVDQSEVAVVRHFLTLVGEAGAHHARMLYNGPWRREPDELLLRLSAFERGLDRGIALKAKAQSA